MQILRFSRAKITYRVGPEVSTIKTHSTFADVEPRITPAPKPPRRAPQPRKNRKKAIKVYGRAVRRPKRPIRPDQTRTIDVIEEPITIPEAVVLTRPEMGKKNIFFFSFCVQLINGM